jgi:streptogramin lyase
MFASSAGAVWAFTTSSAAATTRSPSVDSWDKFDLSETAVKEALGFF